MRVIFTDLDGSLLDHYSYSFAPAANYLERLESQQTPVIAITSKTRAEVLAIREQMANPHPFVIENGAAICSQTMHIFSGRCCFFICQMLVLH
jgi:predicted mannosyl-3-phosphoglycerate phosphatase (HAD superfamily)